MTISHCNVLLKSVTRTPWSQVASTHFRHAKCLHNKGDLPPTLIQLGNAENLFAEMEMIWWNEQELSLRTRVEKGKPFARFAPYTDDSPTEE